MNEIHSKLPLTADAIIEYAESQGLKFARRIATIDKRRCGCALAMIAHANGSSSGASSLWWMSPIYKSIDYGFETHNDDTVGVLLNILIPKYVEVGREIARRTVDAS
jgi:hypothetical protein